MSESIPGLEEWANEAASHHMAAWDQLPEIYLYMDQVLTYLNRQLALYDGTANPLTASMINNYVKDGVLERPQKKKSSRDHLALLYLLPFGNFSGNRDQARSVRKILPCAGERFF